jgi:hypothetical protein
MRLIVIDWEIGSAINSRPLMAVPQSNGWTEGFGKISVFSSS